MFDGKKYFDYPKPVGLIERCLALYTDPDSIVLDFFSGSGTTAHSLFELNVQDGGTRRFILVQFPEKTAENSPAQKDGYSTICDIAKERIRRAGKEILEEEKIKQNDLFTDKHKKTIDIGFRVLKLDSSNMNDVFYTPNEFSEQTLFDENIKSDRTDEDLLFQTMLDLGIELSAKIDKKQVAGKNIYVVSDGYLIACFDAKVDEAVITEIAKLKPYYFVMRDSSLEKDNVADNFDQIFDEYSKDTIRKIL